jgi:uncharacterized membrane protein YidH (DUF202 family)
VRREPTLPAERTRLAWQRTVLACVVCLLGVLRLLAEVAVPLVVGLGVGLVLGAGLVVGATIRRSIRGRDLTTDAPVGRNSALLTGIVAVACLAAMAYVVLA